MNLPATSAKQPRPTAGMPLGDVVGTYLLVFATIVGFAFLADPKGEYLGAGGIPAIKYAPLEFALAAAPWFAFRGRGFRDVPRMYLVLVAATALVLSGAAYTVVALGHTLEASFMGRGLGLSVIVPAYVAVRRPRSFAILTRWLGRCAMAAAAIIAVGSIVWFLGWEFVDEPHIYHEEVFVPVAAAVALHVGWHRPSGALAFAGRGALTTVLLLAGIVTLKNTGFLAVAMGGGMIVYLVWRERGATKELELLRKGLLVGLLLLVAAAGAGAVVAVPEAMPTGTPQLRLPTYLLRMTMFMESPLVGTLFVGTPGIELGSRIVQTHSDILDIVAFGGLLGVAMLVIPVAVLTLRAPRALSRLHELAVGASVSVAFLWAALPVIVMEMLFNPIWHQPHIMYVFAVSAAVALASPTSDEASAVKTTG